MNTLHSSPQIQDIIQEIDRIITEMAVLRNQVVALSRPPTQPGHSVRETEYFGMWADREDMDGKLSREWLESLRAQQWTRP